MKLPRTEAAAIFDWARSYPKIDACLFAVPSGGHPTKRQAASLKRQGIKTGAPEIILAIARKPYHGLFIDLKTYKYGSHMSATERLMHDYLHSQGYKAVKARRAAGAIYEIEQYLKLPTWSE